MLMISLGCNLCLLQSLIHSIRRYLDERWLYILVELLTHCTNFFPLFLYNLCILCDKNGHFILFIYLISVSDNFLLDYRIRHFQYKIRFVCPFSKQDVCIFVDLYFHLSYSLELKVVK